MSEIIQASTRLQIADPHIRILGDANWEALSARCIAPVEHGLDTRESPLRAFFSPRTIAVIGATDRLGSVGRAVMQNLLQGAWSEKLFAINPNRTEVLGVTAYKHISDVPTKIDLAIIVTPAASVPAVIDECTHAGVQAAIILSAGFRETGASGILLEQDLLSRARRTGMRLIGPNCLGIMNPATGLNATFAAGTALPGSVAFLSQSGALCTAILDWSLRERIGFSAFVSMGSMVDVGWSDLIDHFGADPGTRAIAIYMESIGDARAFLSAAREVAITKPIIVIKAGRTAPATQAILSHTGSLSGNDVALDAAFRRAGILRVETIAEMFAMIDILDRQPRPAGHRLSIVTNAGGPAVLAVDAHVISGGTVSELSIQTKKTLATALPGESSRANPVDVLGDASPECYGSALRAVLADDGVDGVLAILTPQAMTDPIRTAEQMALAVQGATKPVMAVWMGGQSMDAGKDVLHRARIPVFSYPETAVRSFNLLARYSESLADLYDTPLLPVHVRGEAADREAAQRIITAVRTTGRTVLTESESKELLTAYGITCNRTHVATTVRDAVHWADEIGYPVALKILSHSITHKNDVNGVRLDLEDAQQVRSAFQSIQHATASRKGAEHFLGVTVQTMVRTHGFELILGAATDPQLGPVVMFGSGGRMVEALDDRAHGLPPLSMTHARRMIEETRISHAFLARDGHPRIDVTKLASMLVRFSQMIAEQPWIRECDINPIAAEDGILVALDARIILHPSHSREEDLPRTAIRGYPTQYIIPAELRDGTKLTLRPIRPEDEPALVEFHKRLSEDTVRKRYFSQIGLARRVSHERLAQICHTDYDRELALVAECTRAQGPEIIGVGRLSRDHWQNQAELAVVIADQDQNHGLGSNLVCALIDVGRREGYRRLIAHMLPENAAMQRLLRQHGFELHQDADAMTVTGELRYPEAHPHPGSHH